MRVLGLLALAACWTKPGPAPTDDHLDDPVHLAAGRKHACRIDSTGALACWGDNAHGQLGVPGTAPSGTPMPVDGTWTWIAAGDRHTCGISNAAVFCWGDDAGKAQVVLPGNAAAVKVFAGGDASCAIDDGGTAYCWGFAPPFAEQSAQPTEVKPHDRHGPWRSFALAADHACAIDDVDASMYCWGANDVEQIAATGTTLAITDAQLAPAPAVAIAVGTGATCAVTLDRGLVCGGDVSTGMVGTAPANTPVYSIDTTQRWTAVALGHEHVCGIANGSVECFGADDRGALGDGTFAARLPLPATTIMPATAVVAGDGFSCAIDAAGAVSCWGSNAYGELGNGEIASRFVPTRLPISGNTIEAVSAGDGQTCVTSQSAGLHHVSCFGDNSSGQVNPSTTDALVATPVEVPPPLGSGLGNGLYKVSAGGHHTCAIVRDPQNNDQDLYCWGANDHGQLGSSDPNVHAVTLAVKDVDPAQAYWIEVAAGASATCAIDDGFTAFCWGLLPGIGDHQPPTPVTTSAAHFAVGGSGFTAVERSNPRIVWSYGIDPLATCSPGASFPTGAQLYANTFASGNDYNVAAGRGHGCAIEVLDPQPGILTCWGDNTHGQTGKPASACTSVPTRVFSTIDWNTIAVTNQAIAAGGDHTCAFDAASNLHCWGRNARGELAGLPDSTAGVIAPPVGVTWSKVATGTWHTCAVADSDLEVDCWGENRFGELGIGTSFHPTPTRIVAP